jgi:uncharacterized protein (TIGR02001 family)
VSLAAAGILAAAAISFESPTAKAQSAGLGPPPNVSTEATPGAMPGTAAVSSFGANFDGSVTSDYYYRGYTLSDHRPSVSGNFEATYNFFFADVNAASVLIPRLSKLQMTDSAGIRPIFGPLTIEAGVEYFSYPGTDNVDYVEFYVAPSYAVTSKFTLGLHAYYAPDYYQSGAWENYDSLTAKYTFDSGLSFSGELGHQNFGTTRATAGSPAVALPDYAYWNLGFSYVFKALTLDLRYHETTLSRQSCFLIAGTGQPSTGSNGCRTAVVVTLSWHGSASHLK